MTALPEVTYVGLQAVEAHSQMNQEERERRGETAAQIIREGALAWAKAC